MDARCLEHLLTEDERLRFECDGYFTVENALPQSLSTANSTVDRVDKAERAWTWEPMRASTTSTLLARMIRS